MATKKAPAQEAKQTSKKSTSTALTLWEKEMEAAAIAQGSEEKNSGGFKSISTRGGILAIDDNAVEDNEIRVIILAAVHENQLYEGDYDPSQPATPVCYAFGKTEDDMVPHEEAPEKQHQNCEECPHNQWGTADKGKGKACKNVRRLLCITEDALESSEALMEAEARMMKLPVTSVKNWTTYVKNTLAEDVKRPSWGVVTLIKVVKDAKTQFKVQFKFEELIQFDQDIYDAMQKRVKEAEKSIASAYPVFAEEEKPKGKKIPIKSVGRVATKASPPKRGKF